jgi:hypothetical protein
MNERKNLPSASNAEADSLCPGRHQAQLGLPETSSSDSEFGNNVHAYLKDRTVKLTAKEQDMADMVLEIEAKVLDTWTKGGERTVEKHGREIRFWGPKKQNSGQVDSFWITGDGKFALIEDTKSLWGEHAEAPRNMQLRDLAVLLWLNHVSIEEVIVFINQPRVTHNPELCVYSTDELMRSCDEMEARVKASLEPNAPRIAGEKQCKFCRAKLACPEAKAMASGVVSYATSHPAIAPDSKSNVAFIVSGLNTLELVTMLERLPVAKWVFEALENEAKARLKAGRDVPGWTLAEGSTLNPIVDAQTVFNRALAVGVPSERFLANCVKVTKEATEEEVRRASKVQEIRRLKGADYEITEEEIADCKLGLKGKSLESEMRKIYEGCTESKPCEPSLKRVKQLKEAA